MKTIFSSSREKKCETCFFSAFDPTADKLLCEKKGLVSRDKKCFRYRYDPFKRVPQATPKVIKPDPKDMTLDVDGKEDN